MTIRKVGSSEPISDEETITRVATLSNKWDDTDSAELAEENSDIQ